MLRFSAVQVYLCWEIVLLNIDPFTIYFCVLLSVACCGNNCDNLIMLELTLLEHQLWWTLSWYTLNFTIICGTLRSILSFCFVSSHSFLCTSSPPVYHVTLFIVLELMKKIAWLGLQSCPRISMILATAAQDCRESVGACSMTSDYLDGSNDLVSP